MNFLPYPTLETERLILRPFVLRDALRVQALAGDRRVAEMTAEIPYPYPDGVAEAWISNHLLEWRTHRLIALAVTSKTTGALVGAVSLRLFAQGPRAELGYWIGVPYWNNGYCTEAARALVTYGFEELELESIQARHRIENPASGRVMEKLGMRCEGVAPHAGIRNAKLLDLVDYSIPAGNFRFRYPAA